MSAAAGAARPGKVLVHRRKHRAGNMASIVSLAASHRIAEVVAAIHHQQPRGAQKSVKFLRRDQRRHSILAHPRIIAATTAAHKSPLQSAR